MMAAGARLAAKGAGQKKDGDIEILRKPTVCPDRPAASAPSPKATNGRRRSAYPTGGPEAIAISKSILLDCANSVPTVVTVPTTAITPDNAKAMMGK